MSALTPISFLHLSSVQIAWKVQHSSIYDIKYLQPFCCARTYNDNVMTFMTWFVWWKKVECTTWSLYQIPHIWCHTTLHINEFLHPGEYSTKLTLWPLCWLILLRDIMVEKRNGESNRDHRTIMSEALWLTGLQLIYPKIISGASVDLECWRPISNIPPYILQHCKGILKGAALA